MDGLELGRFDLVVVGAGMIGSATAYHATCILPPESSVCLVGPEEPKSRGSDPGRSIFGAFYDEGRIARSIESDLVWSVLSQRANRSLLQLQQNSGIALSNNDVGCLSVSSKDDANFLSKAKSFYKGQRLPIVTSSWESLKDKPSLKFFSFPPGSQCVYEYGRAGYVNPRQVVRAHQGEAQKKGCTIVRQVVNTLEENTHDESFRWKLTTDSGQVLLAKKALVATGAFTAFRKLLPCCRLPRVDLKTQTVLFAEIPEEDLHLYKDMPSLAYDDASWRSCYMLPPIRYPDGKYYIKIGHGDQFEEAITTEEQMRAWYQGEAPRHHKEGLQKILFSIIPGLKPASLHTDHCVTTCTPSKHPFIDLLRPSLGVALGGNGHAAKSCHEIGRLAASLIVTGKWSDRELMESDFKFINIAKL